MCEEKKEKKRRNKERDPTWKKEVPIYDEVKMPTFECPTCDY